MTVSEHSVAYTDQPVILIVHSGKRTSGDLIRRRLAKFFGVGLEKVFCKESSGYSCFYVPGLYVSAFGHSFHVSDQTFTATSSPIMDPSVVNAPDSNAVEKFALDAMRKASHGQPPASPTSIFHVDFKGRCAWALNDSFGIGRVYWSVNEGVVAASNNIAALALTRTRQVTVDTSFWDAYYTTGGAIGECTYVRDVHRAAGGTTVHMNVDGLQCVSTHAIEDVLLSARESSSQDVDPARAGASLIEGAKPYFNDRLSIGLSGGRDSRFVTAMALEADLGFQSYTVVPPDLEAEIARRLHSASTVEFNWEVRDRRTVAGGQGEGPKAPPVPAMPIMERAEKFFRFSGGDCWSTFMRRDARSRLPVKLGAMAISGAFGDFARGHYYSEKDTVDSTGASAVDRFQGSFTKTRRILPQGIRDRGAALMQESFAKMDERGFTGFRALDLSFLINRLRRQLPHPAPNTLLPMLTTQMAAATFWEDPGLRVRSEGLRKMTSALRPEWEDVPYFHELAVGTDPSVTNKVTIQPTYWEIDRSDFLESVEHATEVNGMFDLKIEDVLAEIDGLPEGRNRTNVTFEYMFWHAGGTKMLFDINRVLMSVQ